MPKNLAVAAPDSESKNIVGIPVDEDTEEYVIGKRQEGGVRARIVEFLAQNEKHAFTEPMLAEALGFFREGKPHQQRINGPMSKVWEEVQESKGTYQPVEGYVLRLLAVDVDGRRQKAWAMFPAESA